MTPQVGVAVLRRGIRVSEVEGGRDARRPELLSSEQAPGTLLSLLSVGLAGDRAVGIAVSSRWLRTRMATAAAANMLDGDNTVSRSRTGDHG